MHVVAEVAKTLDHSVIEYAYPITGYFQFLLAQDKMPIYVRHIICLAMTTASIQVSLFAQEDASPNEIDFTFDRGSLVLTQTLDAGRYRKIKIIGPSEPGKVADIQIECVLLPDEWDVRLLASDDISIIIRERIEGSSSVSVSEASFLAAALLHSQGQVKIQRWGVAGWNLLRKGAWMDLFRKR